MRRRVYTTAFVTGLLFIVGIAFAAWTVDGSGTGSAKAGTVTNLIVSSGTPTTFLYPGGSADVALTIENPNSFEVTVTGISLDTTQPITSDVVGCGPDVHEVSFANVTGAWLVPAQDTSGVVLTGAASMGSGSPDACQEATFTIPLMVSGVSGTVLSSDACVDDGYEDNDSGIGAYLGNTDVDDLEEFSFWLRMCGTDGTDIFHFTAEAAACGSDPKFATSVAVDAPPDASLDVDLAHLPGRGGSVHQDTGTAIFWYGSCSADFVVTLTATTVPTDGAWYLLTIEHSRALW